MARGRRGENCPNCGKVINGEYTCGSCSYERHRLYKIQHKYGVTPEQYMEMHERQGGRCAICGIHESELPKRLHLDHDHGCCPGAKACGNCARGLLCAKCNTSIGQFENRPELLISAYEYLTGGESDQ